MSSASTNSRLPQLPWPPASGQGAIPDPLPCPFAEEHAPIHLQTIESFFRHKGAYAKFKALLERTQLMERWHDFEAAATRHALESWAADNGFVVVDGLSPPRASDSP